MKAKYAMSTSCSEEGNEFRQLQKSLAIFPAPQIAHLVDMAFCAYPVNKISKQ